MVADGDRLSRLGGVRLGRDGIEKWIGWDDRRCIRDGGVGWSNGNGVPGRATTDMIDIELYYK